MKLNKLIRYIWNRLLCRPRMKSLRQKINEQWVGGKYDVHTQHKIEDIERDAGAYPLYHTTMQMYHSLKLLKNEITKT